MPFSFRLNHVTSRNSFLVGWILLSSVCVSKSNPQPHPDRPDRILETRGEFSVEYSPGQEEYAEAAFEQMENWGGRIENFAPHLDPDDEPIEFEVFDELGEKQDAYLEAVAATIGLSEPSDLMVKIYQKSIEMGKLLANLKRTLGEDGINRLFPEQAVVWESENLRQRLMAGESISPFTYNPQTEKFHYGFSRYYHSFEDADEPEAADTDSESNAPIILPLVITEENRQLSANEMVRAFLDAILGNFLEMIEEGSGMPGEDIESMYKHLVIHEAVEGGLVGHYSRSRDRRSAMDGMAEYVTWKIIRDLDGLDEANRVFPVARQLEEKAPLQHESAFARLDGV